MHDIGKIGVPDEILMKPGPLTDAEREQMKQHALRGYRMLHDSPSRLLQHRLRDRADPSRALGRPGLSSGPEDEEIPLSGRIVAVADVFDALISARVYKPAWPAEKAREQVERQAGTHFDPACVAAFLSRWRTSRSSCGSGPPPPTPPDPHGSVTERSGSRARLQVPANRRLRP